MKSLPLSQLQTHHSLQRVAVVATDLDGTLTHQGKFTPGLLQALEALAAASVAVVIVTGRSAGWVSGLVSYLPVVGAIAENGGIFYPSNGTPVLLTAIADLKTHRQQLAAGFAHLLAEFPHLQETSDNPFRVTDWTFEVAGLTSENLQRLRFLCAEMGWGFTFSTVHCHIKPPNQDKAVALMEVLRDRFPDYSSDRLVTVGDSPNDETLFNPTLFPLSVGVANIAEYFDILTHHPAYLTDLPESEGFCELVRAILAAQLP
ncbi:HAD-IIB family hydrolase [Laspinema olomoucense]|uniref:HAD-IIB family hydrolase n=1 Tax=Laspinema olomoucense TaxID=3231600 RepID=UPI0021BA724E|nr:MULTISPECIES: HAD-IIB family hydrolase [unclassified Laspinema]MCT7975276.1 HAD-IIB family hydrolase [Laspinema sp. D3d]MCT7991128.1 HAD-IIB family hydrolase [Laspinema sp. D3a]MCT7996140.1 HAD-IIB family hydrolase [Laspinema sp. D3c]